MKPGRDHRETAVSSAVVEVVVAGAVDPVEFLRAGGVLEGLDTHPGGDGLAADDHEQGAAPDQAHDGPDAMVAGGRAERVSARGADAQRADPAGVGLRAGAEERDGGLDVLDPVGRVLQPPVRPAPPGPSRTSSGALMVPLQRHQRVIGDAGFCAPAAHPAVHLRTIPPMCPWSVPVHPRAHSTGVRLNHTSPISPTRRPSGPDSGRASVVVVALMSV
jgi:hypothetical protein